MTAEVKLSAREQKSLDNKAAWHAQSKDRADSLVQRRAMLAEIDAVPLKGQELADALRGKIANALKYLDDYTMLNSSGKDLALIVSILIEKMQLIEGKPTAQYDVNISHKIEVMLPQFMAEARRRGLTIDVTPEQIAEAAKP